MNENANRIDDLTPERREQLFRVLARKARDAAGTPPLRRSGLKGTAPLSLAQQRLWILHQLDPTSPAYTEVSALEIRGKVDVEVLGLALREIMLRHEVLRTRFLDTEGRLVQIVDEEANVPLAVIDLKSASPEEQDAEVARLTRVEARTPFVLERGPLLRVTVLLLADGGAVLVVAAHHIVVDGWSMGLFSAELATLYPALRDGLPPALPAPPIQYSDYALWQREALRDEDLARQLDYWRTFLRDIPPLLQLSIAKPRPAQERFEGERTFFLIGSDLFADVQSLCRRSSVTPFMVLLAAFQILLSRYSGQTDVPIGTVVANRSQPEIEHLIGFFVNTLVLRGDLDPDQTVAELLERTRRTALEAYEHQDLPFDQIVEALQPPRAPGYHPIFQVVFNLQRRPRRGSSSADLQLRPLPIRDVPAKFDLILSLEEKDDAFEGYWEYNRDLFDAATVDRMTGHLLTVIREMATAPERRIRDLRILPEDEVRVVDAWGSGPPLPSADFVHLLFEENAARNPDAVALIEAGSEVTYAELDQRANRIANAITTLGAGRESLVAVCARRSGEAIAAILGVLKAGAAYLPLDPANPPQRLATILDDAQPELVLVARAAADSLSQSRAHTILLDELEALTATAEIPRPRVGSNDLAYVIYTSGSTGRPKGVMVTHGNLAASTAARHLFYSEQVSSFLLLPSLSFDSSVAGLFWTLTQGGTLVIPEDQEPVDIPALCRLLSTRRVSHLLCIPSLYAEILHEAGPPQIESLRTVIVAGETCSPKLIEEHGRRLPDVQLFNEYGPTEATVWATVYTCKESKRPVPIGRPIPGTNVYVLDGGLQRVPALVYGELYIGGAGVARGYFRDPLLTAERFLHPGAATDSESLLYRTGDVARFLPDGTLELRGRTDLQVKIHGYRIELGEVEAVLMRHPAVDEAAVVATGEDDAKRLVGHVTGRYGAAATDELREFLLEELPLYMIPPRIVVHERLPRLPNGKVDRPALAALDLRADERPVDEGNEWSVVERQIAQIWQETLDIPPPRRGDHFFAVGGDSLSIIRVYNRLRHISDKLAITDLFKHPTIVDLAQFIESDNVVGEV